MAFIDFLFGKPIPTSDERSEQIGAAAGIPVFGLDALSSAAYGPEAALTLLLPLGAAGRRRISFRSLGIIVLADHRLFLLPADDRGLSGRRRVVHRGVGKPGCICGPAGCGGVADRLRADGGRGNFRGRGRAGSAVPSLLPHTLGICLGILAILTIVNLRGVREAGESFLVPT